MYLKVVATDDPLSRVVSSVRGPDRPWLYGIHGNNFVKTMLGLGKEKETLRVVADQYGCPTCAADLAGAILTIAEQIKGRHNIPWGTYHYCGKGKTTWHGFAEKIFELARQYDSSAIKKVIPVTTAEYPTPARRPHNSVMDCSMLTKNCGISLAPWQESLASMVKTLLTDNRLQGDDL